MRTKGPRRALSAIRGTWLPSSGWMSRFERVEVLLIGRTALAQKLAGNYEAEFELYRAGARALASNIRFLVDDWAIAGSKGRND